MIETNPHLSFPILSFHLIPATNFNFHLIPATNYSATLWQEFKPISTKVSWIVSASPL